ncbi:MULTISPECIES: HlyD family type I secretion periplasmic adaptor subunit [unclassified Mesorhizobium]|jgi:membrane fusion protein, adhesin transport system|uniref:HlyD family type I secretion periplasmic adaptor subunit n=1 Tax=unclassified Mesorhizobium TaxID=325217 RepID=UPI000FCB9D68|nr:MULTISPECIES: HlyD family type I secretion periplasmic adaptor subunit [unclassified Mesorhizobium]RUU13952.1 HlyD family type I secretion periplasmic adaptor subunit [Mesorhizobium sp. M7A.T.Ca.TU.009.01.3.2]RUU64093.1 HlyD family type I secretion periplasmic adaptor subunit [Mesorhizobium sp. M7A.T.Ca.TU.009.01.1.1]RUU83766.1 HlyD family type I secretion periplasmic adaptor subunit [Mesorhizobium sp. M7A.T.Ca.TU.009.01.1.2]RUV03678.1 HlyD family type I secretion periplasmic adaptor subunit
MLAREDRPPLFASASIFIIGALFVVFVAWASFAEVDEIARGDGKVIPASKTQIIQASEAGVVQEIAVTIGQVVKKNDLIIRLDNTLNTSSLGEQQAKARALEVRIARLKYEQAGNLSGPFPCPQDIQSVAPQICDNEQKLLIARRGNFDNKLSVLKSRLDQRERELAEAQANSDRLTKNLVVSDQEAKLVDAMVKKGLMARTEQLRVEREQTELNGQLNLAGETIKKIKSSITEAQLQVEELGLQLQQEALDDLTQALAELSVVDETIRGATDKVARTDIRSPVDGIVNTLELNTVGAFVQPGAVVAGIVPTSETLLVEARVSPRDVAFIRPDQEALIKVTAYDFSIFGGIEGKVSNITADSLVDQKTGEPYYQVRVATDKSTLQRDGKAYSIIPGMICSVDIKTGRKTILHYLLKPINKAREEAMSER